LSAGEAERFDKRRVEKRKAVKNNANDKKKIQKGGGNYPPTIKQGLGWIFCHAKSYLSREARFRFVKVDAKLIRLAGQFHPNSGPKIAQSAAGSPGKPLGPRYIRVSVRA